MIKQILQDIRYALRIFVRNPSFTFVVVLTLALGIAANTAIFSVVNGVLLRDLPFPDSDRIITLFENNTVDGIERDDVSPANFLDWRDRQQSFDQLAFANPYSLDYVADGEPVSLRAALVSKGFFDILGAQPMHGRVFAADEYDDGGRNNVVLLSHSLWQRRFGGDPSIIGKTLTLDEQPMTVVGVMKSDFRLHFLEVDEEIWAPQALTEDLRQQRKATYLNVIGRLKPGVTLEQARADMAGIARNLGVEYPATNSGLGVTAITLPEHLKGKWRLALWILLGAVGFVLYRPHAQSPSGSLIYVVRTRNDATALIPTLRESIWKTSPDQPFYSVTTMDQLVSDSLKARRFNLALLGGFAGLALMLALTGVYSVMSFVTRQRTHEIGVRVALGASARDIARLVLGHGLRLVIAGTLIGAVAAFALTRLMSTLLFGITTTDPMTFAVVMFVLPAAALLACYAPARRATKVDPLVALRYE